VVSLTAEYALRAVAYLAVEHDEPQTVHQIAEATMVPADYLSKVLQELSREGMVRSQRGLYGGFTLVREPSSLTVLDIVQVVSPLHRITECPLRRDGQGRRKLCPLHQLLDEVLEFVERKFSEATVARLVEQAGGHSVLCPPRRKDDGGSERPE